MTDKGDVLDFGRLVEAIQQVHESCAVQVGKAVNTSLTLRNWLIGFYIAEYELRGADRSNYGDNLLAALSAKLRARKISSTGRRQLYNYLSFYRTYPQIVRALSAQALRFISSSAKPYALEKVPTLSAQFEIPPERILNALSYSHLELLVELDDPLKRAFYEIECIGGNCSVRALKRQIASLYYERSGLSNDKEKLAKLVQSGAEQGEARLAIRDPYIFEFLGIKSKEVMGESGLEDALLDKLQDFMLELGHGFCFEARQKRILIGKTTGFVDLVFYHRILKCHMLIELKVDEFTHEHIGQLNTYVSWYRRNMMATADNPPIGLLLCTGKDHALVEYALAGMDNNLFVSKYELELPRKEEIQSFLEEKLREMGHQGGEE